MRSRLSRFTACLAGGLFLAGLSGLAAEVRAQAAHTPVTTRTLPHDPGLVLTAVEVTLAPGEKVGRHHHPGTVFAYVLAGTVRSQLNDGETIEFHAGQSWIEPPGTRHTLTENPSGSVPARFLAMFIAPPGAPLTTMEEPPSRSLPKPADEADNPAY